MSPWKWDRHIVASVAALRSSSMDLSSLAGRIRTSRTRCGGSSVTKELTFLWRQRHAVCRAAREGMSAFSCTRLQVSRPSDRRVLHLIKIWLDCPVEETDQRG